MYLRRLKPRTKFSFFCLHHFFTGYIIALVGFYGIFNFNILLSISIILFGLWIMIDDAVQHILQREQIKLYGYYTLCTFWHWFPYWVLYKLTGKFKEEVGASI